MALEHRRRNKNRHQENVMRKIIELNITETKAIVGGVATEVAVSVYRAPAAASLNIPVNLPMAGPSTQPDLTKRY
jgi:hypothetical protein